MRRTPKITREAPTNHTIDRDSPNISPPNTACKRKILVQRYDNSGINTHRAKEIRGCVASSGFNGSAALLKRFRKQGPHQSIEEKYHCKKCQSQKGYNLYRKEN
jgi:hypothetical protein